VSINTFERPKKGNEMVSADQSRQVWLISQDMWVTG